MDVSIPESLTGFIENRVRTGGYPDANAFVTDLLRSEEGVLEKVSRGEPLPIDARFGRRIEALLDEAEASGDYVGAEHSDFDEMESEALAILSAKAPA